MKSDICALEAKKTQKFHRKRGSNDDAFTLEQFFCFGSEKNARTEIIDEKSYAYAASGSINQGACYFPYLSAVFPDVELHVDGLTGGRDVFVE